MRVVINQAQIDRNKKISHILFFISLGGMGLGFFYTWTANPNSSGSQLSCLILPVLLMMTLMSVRMANLWIREPRPEKVLNEAYKGLSKKYTAFHHVLPAPHVLIGPEGVFTITVVWQERAYTIKSKKWYGDDGILRKLNGYMRQDLIGNPYGEAAFHAQEVQKLVNKVSPDSGVEVQPLIVFINPKANFEAEDPLVPILYADSKKKPSLRAFLKDQTPKPTLSTEAMDKIDELYGLVTRQQLAEMAGEDFEDEADDSSEPETLSIAAASDDESAGTGTVYVVRSGQLFFIGSTTGLVEEAVENLRTTPDRELEVVHSFETKNPDAAKAAIQRRFERKQQRDNWYGLSQKDLSWLKSRR
jgi:hypothetical protein